MPRKSRKLIPHVVQAVSEANVETEEGLVELYRSALKRYLEETGNTVGRLPVEMEALRRTIIARLLSKGHSMRDIERLTGIDRKTISNDVTYLEISSLLRENINHAKERIGADIVEIAVNAKKRYVEEQSTADGYLALTAYRRLAELMGAAQVTESTQGPMGQVILTLAKIIQQQNEINAQKNDAEVIDGEYRKTEDEV